jgi:hypothetical protein
MPWVGRKWNVPCDEKLTVNKVTVVVAGVSELLQVSIDRSKRILPLFDLSEVLDTEERIIDKILAKYGVE